MINTEQDLLKLIGTQESREIDFKQTLRLDENKDSATIELCRDIAAFANTNGGEIIYGMNEENLVATELVGIEIDDLDGFLQKIENKIKDKNPAKDTREKYSANQIAEFQIRYSNYSP